MHASTSRIHGLPPDEYWTPRVHSQVSPCPRGSLRVIHRQKCSLEKNHAQKNQQRCDNPVFGVWLEGYLTHFFGPSLSVFNSSEVQKCVLEITCFKFGHRKNGVRAKLMTSHVISWFAYLLLTFLIQVLSSVGFSLFVLWPKNPGPKMYIDSELSNSTGSKESTDIGQDSKDNSGSRS